MVFAVDVVVDMSVDVDVDVCNSRCRLRLRCHYSLYSLHIRESWWKHSNTFQYTLMITHAQLQSRTLTHTMKSSDGGRITWVFTMFSLNVYIITIHEHVASELRVICFKLIFRDKNVWEWEKEKKRERVTVASSFIYLSILEPIYFISLLLLLLCSPS